MAHLDLVESLGDRDLAALHWWRRNAASADAEKGGGAMPLAVRLVSLAERVAPAPSPIVELPGNRLRANAEARRAREAAAAIKAEIARDPDREAAIRIERRNVRVALGFAFGGVFARLLRSLSRAAPVLADSLRRVAGDLGPGAQGQSKPRAHERTKTRITMGK